MTVVMIEAVLPFQQNEHGHYEMLLRGCGLTGTGMISYLRSQGHHITDDIGELLTSEGTDSYNAKHRLEPDHFYRVPLISWSDLRAPFNQKTRKNFLDYGQQFGYQEPKAEIQLLIQDAISDERCKRALRQAGLYYVAAFHQPISNRKGGASIIYSRRYADQKGPRLATKPDGEWHDPGLMAYWRPE